MGVRQPTFKLVKNNPHDEHVEEILESENVGSKKQKDLDELKERQKIFEEEIIKRVKEI